ncbi:hypothetical protein H6F38_04450 [Paenibacillus sp. EKM208P]|nr:hypothetical protein H6F38_04450 [Paenibacillus sp. EKM208P]
MNRTVEFLPAKFADAMTEMCTCLLDRGFTIEQAIELMKAAAPEVIKNIELIRSAERKTGPSGA